MICAKNIMTKEILTVSKETPIREAIEILVGNSVSGLPVVDDNKHIIGIITEKDMLDLAFSNEVDFGKVEDFMTSDVVTFDEDDDLFDICQSFIENSYKRVPILSDNKLVGIISRRDMIKFILEM